VRASPPELAGGARHGAAARGPEPPLDGEDYRGSSAAAYPGRVRTGEGQRAKPRIERLREDHVRAAMVARHHEEDQEALEADDGARDLGAVLELELSERLGRAIEPGEVGQDYDRPVAARRIDGARYLLRRAGDTGPAPPRPWAVERTMPLARHVLALDPDQGDRHAAQVCVPRDRGLRARPPTPALEMPAVLVDERFHDGPHGEGALPPRIHRVVEHVAHRVEAVTHLLWVREPGDVAPERIGGSVTARCALPGDDVRVVVERLQRADGRGEIGGIVLRLAVRSHDALEAAERDFGLRGDASRCLERGPARQHQRGRR